MATSNLFPPQNVFPPEEYGSGSRPTPLIDAPAWLQAQARGGSDLAAAAPADLASVAPAERASLAPAERAFLESIPSYEEDAPVLPSLVPAALPTPSLARKVLSKLLFVAIAGSASAVLALAVSRMLGHPILP
ncbi:MAG TPA: hypothetical protein VIW29_09145 [Polyangiaceae bacterium]